MVSSAFNRLAPIDFTRYIDRLTERFTGREWLFEQIDRWLKQGDEQFYLLTGEPGVGKSAIAAKLTQIRSDIAAYHFCRAGDVETVRPGRVLRSLAAQLGKTLLHYGEALAKTIDPIHLKINVNINIESLSNSQVTGIYIENLKESNPRDELEILLRAPLAALPDLYAEHNEPLPTLKILLIDSLDEAVTTTGRDNMATLLAALSQVDGLPSWIRFILTARPDLRVLQQFELMKLYKLEELLAQNLDDIERYVGECVQELVVQPESEFQARLEQAELSAETLVREVKELSKGNFLYTRLLMDGIGTGELSLKNLSILPKTLNEVYQRFLRHRCPFRKWSDRYQSILGTLTVTQEAVTQERLVKFTGVDSQQVQDAIGILQQFLDEVEDEQGQKLYAIFHQSLREYLLDRKHNHDFWCDAKEQHDGIIDCFEKESEGWEDLRAIDLYGLRHLAQHLVKGDRVEELHTLLSLEKDGKNAWFKVKDDEGDTAGFLADVELAWLQADEAYDREPGKSIGLQCRYALIKASINSLADNLPNSIVLEAIKQGEWTYKKGVAYALQIPDPQKKATALTNILKFGNLPDVLKKTVFQSTLEAIQLLEGKPRIQALVSLSSECPEVVNEALETAEAMSSIARVHLAPIIPVNLLHETLMLADGDDNWIYSRGLTAMEELICHLPDHLLPSTLESARLINDIRSRRMLLSFITPRLPDALLTKAFDIAKAISEEYQKDLETLICPSSESLLNSFTRILDIPYHVLREQTLKAFVSRLPDILLWDALQVIRSLGNRNNEALIALASKIVNIKSKKLLIETYNLAKTIDDPYYRTQVLTSLVLHLPDAVPEAFKSVQQIQDESNRAEMLAILASSLDNTQLDKIVQLARLISPKNISEIAQLALSYVLPEVLSEIIKVSYQIKDKNQNIQLLIALSDYLPNALDLAFQILKSMRDDDEIVQAVKDIIPHLPDTLLPEALQIIKFIQDPITRFNAFLAIIPRCPDTITSALNLLQEFQSESDISQALTNIIPLLSDLEWDKVLKIIQKFSKAYQHYKARNLMDLIPFIPKRLLHKVIEVSKSLSSYYHLKVLITLLARQSEIENIEDEIIKICLELNDVSRLEEYLTLIPYISNDCLLKTEADIVQIVLKLNPRDLLRSTASLAPYLTCSSLSQLLSAIMANFDTRNEYIARHLCEGLGNVIPYFSILMLNEIYIKTISWTNDVMRLIRAEILAKISSRLPEVLPEAIREVRKVLKSKHNQDGVASVIALILHVPCENLCEVFQLALLIQDSFSRMESLKLLSERDSKFTPNMIEEVSQLMNAKDYVGTKNFAIALTRVKSYLTTQSTDVLLNSSLKIIQSIDEEGYRAQALNLLIPYIQNQLLLEASQVVQKLNFGRGEVLSSLTLRLTRLSTPYLTSLWKNLIHGLSFRTRNELLDDLIVMVSVINQLGGQAAMTEVVGAVQDVTCWWA